MNTVEVDTRLENSGMWHCWTELPDVGRVVIGSGRSEHRAQYHAAQFMDRNYPKIAVEWIGGYHGGDTSKQSIVLPSDYWGER